MAQLLGMFNRPGCVVESITPVDQAYRVTFRDGGELIGRRVILAAGAAEYNFSGAVARTGARFKSDGLHGLTFKFSDEKTKEHLFAVIFLPGKAKTATKKQKEVVIVHEFIHACGVDEHDTFGIMFGVMAEEGGGLIEYIKTEGANPMPPIRVGSKTLSVMQNLWPRGGTPKSK